MTNETETETDCYCEDWIMKECHFCEMARETAEEKRVCQSWSWNCSPRECAEEAYELGWSEERLSAAMKTNGFSERNIKDVLFEFGPF